MKPEFSARFLRLGVEPKTMKPAKFVEAQEAFTILQEEQGSARGLLIARGHCPDPLAAPWEVAP